MKKLSLLLYSLFFACVARADNVILMIGDGMGANHLACAAADKPLYLSSLPVKGWVHTRSADNTVTDSAAAATAYACGGKTNNRMVGKRPDGHDCTTLAQEAVQHNFTVGIYSTDHATGATPSAFFAHTDDRNNKEIIEQQKAQAAQTMDIAVPVSKISEQVLLKLPQKPQNFFMMFEGAHIDTSSHKNDLKGMKEALYDFDLAVMYAADYVRTHPHTTLIVLADHETGGLTDACVYTTNKHTGVDIPVFAYGKHAKLFAGTQDNTDIHHKIHQILFGKASYKKTPSE